MSQSKKRMLATTAVGALAIAALALPPSMTAFDKLYSVKSDSNLGKAKCMVCHMTVKGGKALNAYGKDLKSAMKDAKSHKVTEAILKSVEQLDSAGTGKTNLSRIKADKLPGGN